MASLLIFFINSLLFQVSNYWAGRWAQHNYPEVHTDNEYGYVMLGIMGAIFLTLLLRAFTFSVFSSNASYILFNKMLSNILHRPMSFFDTTPNGQIMNRFNGDTI